MDRAILDKYRERWVAIDSVGAVIADAERANELLDALELLGLTASHIQRIPAADEPYFVGLR